MLRNDEVPVYWQGLANCENNLTHVMFAARYLNNSKVKCNFEIWHKNDYERLNCEKRKGFLISLKQIFSANCKLQQILYNNCWRLQSKYILYMYKYNQGPITCKHKRDLQLTDQTQLIVWTALRISGRSQAQDSKTQTQWTRNTGWLKSRTWMGSPGCMWYWPINWSDFINLVQKQDQAAELHHCRI